MPCQRPAQPGQSQEAPCADSQPRLGTPRVVGSRWGLQTREDTDTCRMAVNLPPPRWPAPSLTLSSGLQGGAQLPEGERGPRPGWASCRAPCLVPARDSRPPRPPAQSCVWGGARGAPAAVCPSRPHVTGSMGHGQGRGGGSMCCGATVQALLGHPPGVWGLCRGRPWGTRAAGSSRKAAVPPRPSAPP